MKVKEIERTVNTSWSPADHHPILLAAGTAAQQLDATFNTSAALEIYALNLTEPSLDLELKSSVPSAHRFHRVSWGGTGSGVIVGGCHDGVIQMYDVAKLMANEDSLIASPERHTGPVRSLDFNPFQNNLLATGATNSEIFIWDINNTTTPMTPGTKAQPFEEVAWLAWNRQVQHILASTFPTRAIVWDLRKNEPIIKLTDTTTRVRWKVVAWHPEVATQLCLASEEDTSPLIQLWDLRFATAPVKTFHGHTRGVLSLAWCSQDPDLLISSGKDNKIICWDPNTNISEGEIVCEIPNSQQWIFDVSWCPRNPLLIVSSSCDGHTSVYSLSGSANQMQANNKIAESFPGMGDYSEPQVHSQQQPVVNLKNAPKWLKKQVGARFGFGGKLVTYGSQRLNLVQVHEDDSFLERAHQLDQRISEGRYHEICQGKQDPVWRYLEASFSPQPRAAFMELLGYNKESVLKLLGVTKQPNILNDVDHMSGQFSHLGQDGYDHTGGFQQIRELVNGGDLFDNISAQNTPEKKTPFKISIDNDIEGKVCKALLVGGIEEAINICLDEGKMADALVLSMAAGPEILSNTQMKYFQKREGYLTNIITALVNEDWTSVVLSCDLASWKEALTAVLTYSSDEAMPALCKELGARLEEAGGEYSSCADICYIASGNVAPLIHKRTSEVTLTPTNIQELLELVLVAQAAMSSHGHSLPIVGDVANLIVNYSEILAAQGDLASAMKYLNDSQDERILELRTRLGCALGDNSQMQYPQPARMQIQQQIPQVQPSVQNIRKPSLTFQQGHAVQQHPITNSYVKPPMSSMGPLVTPVAPSPAPMGNYGMPPTVQGSKPVLPNSAVVAPPPSGGTFTRNTPSPQVQGAMKKYVVDPSVAGGGYNRDRGLSQRYNHQPSPQISGFGSSAPQLQSSNIPPLFPPNVPQSAGPFQQPPVSMIQPPVSSYQPPVSTFQQPPVSSFQPPSSNFQPTSYQSHTPNPSFRPGFPGMSGDSRFVGQNQNASFHPNEARQTPFKPPSSVNNPVQDPSIFAPPQPSYNQTGMSGMPIHDIPSAQHGSPSGWNDPPVLSGRSNQRSDTEMFAVHSGMKIYNNKKKQPKQEFIPQNPITHPLFGSAPTEMTTQQYQPQQQMHNQNIAPMMQQHQPPQQQTVGGYGEPPITMGRAAEPTKPKAQMPQQYVHIQNTFEDLRTKCIAKSQNALTKRKLEDVARKLETLYDHLRDGRLSADTLVGLEKLVQCVQNVDYVTGLAIVTQMVSGPDFSQIATFMTGLKILLQTAEFLFTDSASQQNKGKQIMEMPSISIQNMSQQDKPVKNIKVI